MVGLLSEFVEILKLARTFIIRETRYFIVNDSWLQESGQAQKLKNGGYDIRWTARDKVESRKLRGWEIVSISRLERLQRLHKIPTLRDGSVLMKRKRENDG